MGDEPIEIRTLKEKLLFYTTAFFILLGTFSMFAFLFLVPFVIEPAFTTIFMQFEELPALCETYDVETYFGAKNCSWASCREGCTKDIYTCTQIRVNYRINLYNYTDEFNFTEYHINLKEAERVIPPVKRTDRYERALRDYEYDGIGEMMPPSIVNGNGNGNGNGNERKRKRPTSIPTTTPTQMQTQSHMKTKTPVATSVATVTKNNNNNENNNNFVTNKIPDARDETVRRHAYANGDDTMATLLTSDRYVEQLSNFANSDSLSNGYLIEEDQIIIDGEQQQQNDDNGVADDDDDDDDDDDLSVISIGQLLNAERRPFDEISDLNMNLLINDSTYFYVGARLFPNVKGCGYPPMLNCTIWLKRYTKIGIKFPCYYSKVDPSLVISDLDYWQNTLNLIYSMAIPIPSFIISVIYLTYAYFKIYNEDEETAPLDKNAEDMDVYDDDGGAGAAGGAGAGADDGMIIDDCDGAMLADNVIIGNQVIQMVDSSTIGDDIMMPNGGIPGIPMSKSLSQCGSVTTSGGQYLAQTPVGSQMTPNSEINSFGHQLKVQMADDLSRDSLENGVLSTSNSVQGNLSKTMTTSISTPPGPTAAV